MQIRVKFGRWTDGQYIEPDFEIVRAWALCTVNDLAGLERVKYATNIPFQGDLYQLKEQEALGYQSDPTGYYPILTAESSSRNISPADLATEYLTNAALFPQILAAIEGVRMATITAIKSADSIGEIESALANVVWPEFTLPG